jgi:NAD(P)-dependent dehydrogenase (short-subunit alcohol dehydrogenase family)
MSGCDFAGRTAIVTGASRGIGLATARLLVAGGANVVLTSRSQDAADQAAAEVTSGDAPGVAIGIGAHAANSDAVQACVSTTLERFGRIDILINNAGTNPAFGPVLEQSYERFAKTIEVNLWAPVLWTASVAQAWMTEHGGCVVNTASLGGLMPAPNLGIYNASKAGLIYLTRQLAAELAPGIRVNAVAPGVVRTRMAEALWREQEQSVASSMLLGRIGEPDDVAGAIAYLASDAASWITGETLLIDGGQIFGDAQQFRTGSPDAG